MRIDGDDKPVLLKYFAVKLSIGTVLRSEQNGSHFHLSSFLFVGLMERIKDGETVIQAEGYIFEFERRGYLKAGHFVPEVVLEHPDLVKESYREFVHAGSDVVLALTVRRF